MWRRDAFLQYCFGVVWEIAVVTNVSNNPLVKVETGSEPKGWYDCL